MIQAWRIVKARFADDAFSGEGSRIHGGRWNSPQQRVVYTASSLSLATLELLVQLRKKERAREYVVLNCWFPEAIMEEVERSLLPQDWRAYPSPPALQQIGNAWLLSRSSAVLRVPSAVVEEETNYLLNPEHDDFRSIDIGLPRPFDIGFHLVT